MREDRVEYLLMEGWQWSPLIIGGNGSLRCVGRRVPSFCFGAGRNSWDAGSIGLGENEINVAIKKAIAYRATFQLKLGSHCIQEMEIYLMGILWNPFLRSVDVSFVGKCLDIAHHIDHYAFSVISSVGSMGSTCIYLRDGFLFIFLHCRWIYPVTRF